METLKLDQYQIDYLIQKLSMPSAFDTIQLSISILTVGALIYTLMLQRQTAKDQLSAALLDRKAKMAEYMPFIDLKFSLSQPHEQDDFGSMVPKTTGPAYFYLEVSVIKNTLTLPQYRMESNLEGFTKVDKKLNKDSYWTVNEVMNFGIVGEVQIEDIARYTKENPRYVRCTFTFEDLLGNAYTTTSKITIPGKGTGYIESAIPFN